MTIYLKYYIIKIVTFYINNVLKPLPQWQREGINMAEVRVGKNETLDTALKRFKRSCAKDGVIAEVRKREHYEKPSVKRKLKSEAARKRKF